MSTLNGRVTDVYTVTDATSPNYGQTLVNVATGGPDGTAGVVSVLPVPPRVGDNVGLLEFGSGLWAVIANFTNPQVSLQVPKVHVQNDAPTSGYTQVSAQYFTSDVFDQPDMILVPASPVVPPPPSGGTQVFNAVAGHSWRDDFGGSWSNDSGRLYQGIYSGFGPWTGLWFYPDLVTPLAGHTVMGGSIHLHRAGAGGSAGPVQVHLWLHDYASQPAGKPALTDGPIDSLAAQIGWNGSADVPLPLGWVQALAAGTAKGVGIYATDQSSYSILLGPDEDASSGQLTITYS